MSKVTEYACHLIELPYNADVLDIGCKNADTLKYFQSVFGDRCGALIGIDKNPKHFETPEKLAGTSIELMEMDASDGLRFPDNRFDFIFHKNTLECITDKAAHIQEIHRILKPGGLIVCIHADWESVVFNCENKELMNKAIYAYANWQQPWMDDFDSWIGRRIWGHFNKTKLFSGKYFCYNDIETQYNEGTHGYSFFGELAYLHKEAGFLSENEYNELKSDIEVTYQSGEYMFSMPYYIYLGRKK